MNAKGLIACLGNPGAEYETTRHNMGFMAADALLDSLAGRKSADARVLSQGPEAVVHAFRYASMELLLIKPMAYMNLSGPPVARTLGRYGLGAGDLLLVHDEMDLPLGRMKFKASGGANLHNGVDSVIHALGTGAFNRLRLGIGRPTDGTPAKNYVLEPFSKAELEEAGRTSERAAKAVLLFFRRGRAAAMQFAHTVQTEDKD